MVIEGNRTVRDVVLQKLLPALELLNRQLAEPLERRIRFRHEAGHGNRDPAATPALDFSIKVDDFLSELGNTNDIFVRLRRQAHHKVELDLLPALAEGRTAGLHEIFFRDALVDDIAQTLRAGFRRKRQTRFSDLLHLMRKVNREAVNAQRRQRKADFFILKVVHEVIDKTAEARIVRRRQGSQAHLIISRRIDEAARHLAQILLRALAGWAIANAGLAEAATA